MNTSKRKKILIVDDSIISRRKIRAMIPRDKYDIAEANDGKQGLEKIFEESFDCILLDLLMPKIDGIGVLEQLKQSGVNTPTIVVSADIQETTREKCFQLGAFDFLNKPPKPEELMLAIERSFNIKL